MRTPTGKTARFKELVEQCGAPELYTPWMDPKRDPKFQSAWRENRVLSVRQPLTGNKKDFGEVGFTTDRNVAYLIFPKKLDAFAGRRIVGIQYSLVATPKPHGRRSMRAERPKRVEPPALKRFEVTVRVMAAVDITEIVEASSIQAAEETVTRQIESRDIDFADAEIAHRVVKAKKL
jgi:hypothetical protein